MRRLAVVFACALSSSLSGVQAGPQSSPAQATFRAAVDLVDVDVSVLDANRLPVLGLTAADFTVLEDGASRPIEAFSAVDLPPRRLPDAPWMAETAPDLLSNVFPREGRLVVILMDQSLEQYDYPAAQRFAEAAVEQLRPGDLAAVAYTARGIPQNFTADRARLLSAIRAPFMGLPDGDAGSPGECSCGACSMETVADIAEALQTVRQRRKMLLIASSRIAVQSAGPCGGVLTNARKRAMRAVEAGNVTVHTFDPTGLPTLAVSASATGRGNRSVMAHMRRRGDLGVLPGHTGGRLVSDPIRPADRAAELFRESNSYYVLGFQPAATVVDGRFRKIEVKVARRGVTLQARRGYYAGAASGEAARPPASAGLVSRLGDVTPALGRAIAGLWPATDVSLQMTAAPFAMPDLRTATVAVIVRVGQRFDDMNSNAAGSLREPESTTVNVLVGAFDRNGRAMATRQQTISVLPRQVVEGGFEYEVISRLELRPGRYEVRAAVEDTRLGRTGSVYGYVDVPDYQRAPVALSGLLIDATPARVLAPASGLEGVAPVTPTARRDFARTDLVTGFVRLYQGLGRAMMPGYVTAEILDERDQSVYRQESRILPDQYGASRAMDFSVDVPVARLAPGEYVLSIEARHGSDTARRDARFVVR